MIEVNLKPYCDECPNLRANTNKEEQISEEFTMETVTRIVTRIECIHKNKCDQIESYIKESVQQDINPWMNVNEFQPSNAGKYEVIVKKYGSDPVAKTAHWKKEYGGHWDTDEAVLAWRNLSKQHNELSGGRP